MPLKDTIQTLSDSAQLAIDSLQHRDSILLADSLQKADSIAYADSVRLHTFYGYDGILPIGLPSDQNWVFILLLALFGVLVLAFIRSISPPQNIFLTFFSAKERGSIFVKTSIDNFEQKVYFFIFSVATISLFSYLSLYSKGTAFDFYVYLRIVLTLFLYFLFKYFISRIFEFVFFAKNNLKQVYDSYLHVLTIVAAIFYPLILLLIYYKGSLSLSASQIGLTVIIVGLLLFVTKLVQFFLHKVVVSLYLMLYLCTLEILPLFILVEVFRYITKSV